MTDYSQIGINGVNETNIYASSARSNGSSGDCVSIFDNYENKYETSDWEDIKPTKGFFSSKYTYNLSDGTKITLEDIEDVIVRVNKKTGEILLVGAENAQITGSNSGVKISVYDSTLSNLNTGQGNDTVNLYNTDIVGNINTNSGNDKIRLYNGSTVNNIFTGNGQDDIAINNSKINGKIDGGAGNDKISILNNSQVKEISGGLGNDNISITGSTILSSISGGSGEDTINVISNSTIKGDVSGNEGDDKITINKSRVNGKILGGEYLGWFGLVDDDDTINVINGSTVNDIQADSGNDTIKIENSTVNGKLEGNGGNDKITAKNAKIKEVYGGKDDDTFVFENTTISGNIVTGANIVKFLDLLNGNDTVTVEGSKTKDIETGSGDDKVNVGSGSTTGKIDTGKGDDKVNVSGGSTTGNIETGKGNDTVNVSGGSKTGNIDAGAGDDIITVDKSETGNIKGGDGNDNINIDQSKVSNIEGNEGNDTIEVVDSETGKIDGGKGTDNIYYDNSSNIEEIVSDDKDSITLMQGLTSLQNISEDSTIIAQGITNNIASKYTNKVLTEEEQYYVLVIDTLAQNLENMKAQFEDQEKEDGALRDGYNWIKELTDIGISKEDIKSAMAEQEKMLKEMISALNEEGEESFEEVYKRYTGLEYNQENVSEYLESAQIYSLAVNGLAKASSFQEQIKTVDSLGQVLELYQSYYGEEKGREKLNEMLQEGFYNNGEAFNWVKSIEINDKNELVITRPKEYNMMGPIDGTEYETTVEDISSVTNMLKTMPMYFEENKYTEEYKEIFESEMGYSIDRIQAKYVADQSKTFGNSNSFQKLIDKYCADQEGFADKLSTIGVVGGIGMMVVGGVLTFVCPPAGVTLMNAGKWTAIAGTFSDNAIDLVDNLASENGLTKEEAWGLMKETITDIALLYSGAKINGVATSAKDVVLNATQNKALAFLSEIGTDASLSLLTDLMITGEIDITGEGISQILGIITGIAGAKVSTYTKEAFYSADALFKQGDIDGAYDYLKTKGISEKQIYNKYAEYEIARISDFYKSSGNYDDVLKMIDDSKILNYDNGMSQIKILSAINDIDFSQNKDVFISADSIFSTEGYDSAYNYLKQRGFSDSSIKSHFSTVEIENIKQLISTDQLYMDKAIDMIQNSQILSDEVKNSLVSAVNGLYSYQYNSEIANRGLRNNTLNKFAEVLEIDDLVFFVENGYDMLSTKLNSDMTVYRKVYASESYPAEWNIGQIVNEKAFTSTCLEKGAADPYLNKQYAGQTPVNIEIVLPAGANVVMSASMTEVLIKNGASFKVTGYDKVNNVYTWELILDE